jgi:hypothetical protein
MPERITFGHQRLKVVYLAVKNHGDGAIFIEKRLLTGGNINNRQSPMPECQPRLQVEIPLIRPAMALNVVHSLHQGTIKTPFATRIKKTRQTAHVTFLFFPGTQRRIRRTIFQ